MNKQSNMVMATVAFLSIASVVTWQATGGDWYTKYEVVEQVESNADPNDPLVAAGFYEGGTTTQTVTRTEFRFGLLPTPAGIFDKHALSVASVTGPLWVLGLGYIWFQRWRSRLRKS
jgi:hypothetical protein